jgi:hypothetical protein
VPFGALLVVAIVLLGPVLGRALYAPLAPARVWPGSLILPTESREQAAYLLALLAVAGFGVAIAVLARPAARLVARGRFAAPLAQLAVVAFGAACVIEQNRLVYVTGHTLQRARYFTVTTWIGAALIAAGIALAIRATADRRRLRALVRERRIVRWLSAAVAITVTAGVMIACIDSDTTIATHWGVQTIVPYVLDESFAVVNGRTPFVDFQPAYATLWPLVAATALKLIAPTLLVFTLTMYALSVTALLGIFDVLRRAARSSLTALLLYVPFLATTLFLVERSTVRNAYSAGNYYPSFPLRYAGPYLLAWLTTRTLDTRRPRARPLLFAAAGLVIVNNANFGAPALAGTVVAILCTSGPLRRPLLIGLARDVVLGLLAAGAALSAFTLARAGALPDFSQMTAYGSFFLHGFLGTALPALLGIHLVLYVTFAGALAAAVVRALSGAANRVLTGMLAWSAVFGLGAGSYYVAESGPLQMRMVFSAWALALALLGVLVLGRLSARPRRWPSLAEAAVLLGLGVMACSIPQLPRPWSQLERLQTAAAAQPANQPFAPDLGQRSYLASVAYGRHDFYVKRGAPVALLIEAGHRAADAFGFRDVNRYPDINSMFGSSFLRRVVADLRHAGGNTLVMEAVAPASPYVAATLAHWGFGVLTSTGVRELGPHVRPLTTPVNGVPTFKWVDLRHLRPAALRRDRGTLVASYPARG